MWLQKVMLCWLEVKCSSDINSGWSSTRDPEPLFRSHHCSAQHFLPPPLTTISATPVHSYPLSFCSSAVATAATGTWTKCTGRVPIFRGPLSALLPSEHGGEQLVRLCAKLFALYTPVHIGFSGFRLRRVSSSLGSIFLSRHLQHDISCSCKRESNQSAIRWYFEYLLIGTRHLDATISRRKTSPRGGLSND